MKTVRVILGSGVVVALAVAVWVWAKPSPDHTIDAAEEPAFSAQSATRAASPPPSGDEPAGEGYVRDGVHGAEVTEGAASRDVESTAEGDVFESDVAAGAVFGGDVFGGDVFESDVLEGDVFEEEASPGVARELTPVERESQRRRRERQLSLVTTLLGRVDVAIQEAEREGDADRAQDLRATRARLQQRRDFVQVAVEEER